MSNQMSSKAQDARQPPPNCNATAHALPVSPFISEPQSNDGSITLQGFGLLSFDTPMARRVFDSSRVHNDAIQGVPALSESFTNTLVVQRSSFSETFSASGHRMDEVSTPIARKVFSAVVLPKLSLNAVSMDVDSGSVSSVQEKPNKVDQLASRTHSNPIRPLVSEHPIETPMARKIMKSSLSQNFSGGCTMDEVSTPMAKKVFAGVVLPRLSLNAISMDVDSGSVSSVQEELNKVDQLASRTHSNPIQPLVSEHPIETPMARKIMKSSLSQNFSGSRTTHEVSTPIARKIFGGINLPRLSLNEISLYVDSGSVNSVQEKPNKDQLLASPRLWGLALEEFPSLLPQKPLLGSHLLDYYVLSNVLVSQNRHEIYYLPVDIVSSMTCRLQEGKAPYHAEQRLMFLNICGIEPWKSHEIKPVAFVIYQHEHCFVVVFSFLTSRAYVFGRESTIINDPDVDIDRLLGQYHVEQDDWREWHGSEFWNGIGNLFGYDTEPKSDDTANEVLGLDWWASEEEWFSEFRNSCDFLDENTELKSDGIEILGLRWSASNKQDCGPNACFVLQTLLWGDGLTLTDEEFSKFPPRPCSHDLRCLIAHHILDAAAYGYERYEILKANKVGHYTWLEMSPSSIENWTKCYNLGQKRLRRLLTSLTQVMQEGLCHRVSGHDTQIDVDSTREFENTNYHLRIRPTYTSLRTVAARTRHSFALPIHKQCFEPLAFDNFFDDYLQGPTIEENKSVADQVYNSGNEEPTNSVFFRDYGYRLHRNFCLAFNTSRPCQHHERYLPVPHNTRFEDPFRSITEYNISRTVDESRPQGNVRVEDIVKMGLAEMMEESKANSDAGFQTFIQGKDRNQRHIFVDLKRDAVKPRSIDVSFDIDSLIWITHELHFKQALKIHLKPYIRRSPPIGVHNHMSVNIFIPQNDIERANGTFPISQTFKLSSIPHIHFAQYGEHSGSTNVSVLFPRMIHRLQTSRFWATSIPLLIQDRWFKEVVYPALSRLADSSQEPYLKFTPEEWAAKANKVHSICIRSDQISQFQMIMREIIKESIGGNDLSMFGSFFFVVDSRGIKLLTKKSAEDHSNIMVALAKELPYLDLEYMADRKNGECVLDLGVSFNPVHPFPVVGIWSVPHVDASFAISGTNAPTIHPVGTMSHYGSLKAVYLQETTAVVHFVMSLAYNLCFETVRNCLEFCKDSDAYEGNSVWKDCVADYLAKYEGARVRNYGVRHEIRMSIRAAGEIILQAKQKAKAYIESGAAVWVPSRVWFDFWAQRIQAIRSYQLWLSQTRPTNLAVWTCVLMYMFRSVFTTPTVNNHLQGFLEDLRFQEISERFGLFFLHTAKPLSACIRELPAEDPDDLISDMAIKRRRKPKPLVPHFENADPSSQFPLGEAPTWQELVDGIKNKPSELIRRPRPQVWRENPVASQIFIQFTREYWFALHQKYLIGDFPNPSSLQEAIDVWSVDNIIDSLWRVSFTAVRAFWPGLPPGRREKTFEEMFEVFFPPADGPCNSRSIWSDMWKYGYIKIYHDKLENMEHQDGIRLQMELKKLLDTVQCLPHASGQTENSLGHLWTSNETKNGPEVLTNPKLYKIRSLRKEATGSKRVHVVASRTMLKARIKAHNENRTVKDVLLGEKRKKRNEERSLKAKNRRKPPQNRYTQKKVVCVEDTEFGDSEETSSESTGSNLDSLGSGHHTSS